MPAAAAGWRKRVEVIVELGLRGEAAGSFQWDASSWDAGSGWSGLEPTFVALDPSEVQAVQTSRGRRSGADRHKTGTASVTLVWEAPGGHWIFRPESVARLGQELRIRARLDGASELLPIYRGSIRDIKDEWDPDGPYRITLGLSDRKADLAAVDLPERPVEGLGDTTDGRLTRILGLAGISSYYERFGASSVEHGSSNFARNLLDEAEVSVEGEPGSFYVDREGFYVFRPRGWYLVDPRSTDVQLVWTNLLGDPEAASPDGFSTAMSLQDLVNQVSMSRAGGTAYTAGPDTDSALTYGLRTYQRFDLTLRFDADVAYAADDRLAQLKDRRQRVEALSLELNPQAPTEALRRALDMELGDLHQILWDTGTEGADPFSEAYHVQGIQHRISMDSWSVQADLWHYVGVTLGATWGSAIWGSSEWGA